MRGSPSAGDRVTTHLRCGWEHIIARNVTTTSTIRFERTLPVAAFFANGAR
jgi:hypothetical protein